MDSIVIEVLWMPERREGQELIRLYLPAELKEMFKLYCQLKGTTMTEVITEQIENLIKSEDFTQILQQRLKDTPHSSDKGNLGT
jgi:hypothetical protein